MTSLQDATVTTRRLLGGSPQDLTAHLAAYGPLRLDPVATAGTAGPLVKRILDAGLRGRGGGWFPTGQKMTIVAQSANGKRCPIIVGNGMEGEPASGKDAILLANRPHLVLDGLVLSANALGATEIVLAVHRGSRAATTLIAAIAERTSDPIAIQLVTPPGRYVASEESALTHWIDKGLALPTTTPPRPAERGVLNRPTMVNNVESYAHIALIARYGAQWYRSAGTVAAPGTTLVSVLGAVARPVIVEVAVGTPLSGVIALAGGLTKPVQAWLTGGYGGTWIPGSASADLPWSPEGLRVVGGTVGAGILVALPTDVCGIHETARVVRWMSGESAGQCGPCRFGLAALADDFDDLATGNSSADKLDRLWMRLGLIPGRGACKHPDGVARMAATALEVFAADVAAHLQRRCLHGFTRTPNTALLPIPSQARQSPVPDPRDRAAKGLWK